MCLHCMTIKEFKATGGFMSIKRFLPAVLILLIGMGMLFGQDFKEQAAETAPLILKALNYNKTLKDKMKKDCVIALLYNPESENSNAERKALEDALNDNKKIKVYDKNLKVVNIPMDRNVNLEKKIIINKINAFWVTSDIDAYLPMIRESAKYNQVITLSNNDQLVTSSQVAMGTQKTDSGYKVIVNLNEANNIHVDLNANLLSTAIVVQQ